MAASSKDNIRRVREDFVNRRGAAFEKSERKKLLLYPIITGLREIDMELAQTGTKIMAATMSGEDIENKIAQLRAENKELRDKRAALLISNGYPADYTDINYRCLKCFDTGFAGVNMCSCMKSELAAAMLESTGIGRLAKVQSFENFSFDYYTGAEKETMRHNYNELYEFACGFNSSTEDNFLLIGGTGLGKTHLSTAIAAAVIQEGYDVIYETMQELVDNFAEEQFRGGSHDLSQRYYDADLLIIDDLGTELTNQFTISCLYNLINRRINKSKPTVFSTNLTQKELRERYADRITSRLFGEYKPLVFVGTDIRRQKLTFNK